MNTWNRISSSSQGNPSDLSSSPWSWELLSSWHIPPSHDYIPSVFFILLPPSSDGHSRCELKLKLASSKSSLPKIRLCFKCNAKQCEVHEGETYKGTRKGTEEDFEGEKLHHFSLETTSDSTAELTLKFLGRLEKTGLTIRNLSVAPIAEEPSSAEQPSPSSPSSSSAAGGSRGLDWSQVQGMLQGVNLSENAYKAYQAFFVGAAGGGSGSDSSALDFSAILGMMGSKAPLSASVPIASASASTAIPKQEPMAPQIPSASFNHPLLKAISGDMLNPLVDMIAEKLQQKLLAALEPRFERIEQRIEEAIARSSVNKQS